jgi:hypothetical protein
VATPKILRVAIFSILTAVVAACSRTRRPNRAAASGDRYPARALVFDRRGCLNDAWDDAVQPRRVGGVQPTVFLGRTEIMGDKTPKRPPKVKKPKTSTATPPAKGS